MASDRRTPGGGGALRPERHRRLAAAAAAGLFLAPGAAAAHGEDVTAASVRVGVGLAALTTASYLAVGLLSRDDDGSRAVGAVGGALAGAGIGFLIPALLIVALKDRLDDDTTLALIVVPVALATILGGAIGGGAAGYEATADPHSRVEAHVAIGGAMMLGLSLPFGALLYASEALED